MSSDILMFQADKPSLFGTLTVEQKHTSITGCILAVLIKNHPMAKIDTHLLYDMNFLVSYTQIDSMFNNYDIKNLEGINIICSDDKRWSGVVTGTSPRRTSGAVDIGLVCFGDIPPAEIKKGVELTVAQKIMLRGRY